MQSDGIKHCFCFFYATRRFMGSVVFSPKAMYACIGICLKFPTPSYQLFE